MLEAHLMLSTPASCFVRTVLHAHAQSIAHMTCQPGTNNICVLQQSFVQSQVGMYVT